ncbi:MAG TPA: zf-HC2 domain-containing protein [Bacteroidales bacterium]|nr:zf-HC2 domain-containing protein [Bacteroidales bacterium]
MNCIKDHLIQKYIDGEALPEEVVMIEEHLNNCDKCSQRAYRQRRLSGQIKKAINQFHSEAVEIPKFQMPSNRLTRQELPGKKLYYVIAAACILLVMIIFPWKEEPGEDHDILFETGSAMDIDANRSASDFPLIINLIDTKGNITEYVIE